MRIERTVCGITLDRIAEIDNLINSVCNNANSAHKALASVVLLDSEADDLANTCSMKSKIFDSATRSRPNLDEVTIHGIKETQLITAIGLEWLCLKILIRSEHGKEASAACGAKLTEAFAPLNPNEMDEAMLGLMGSVKSDLANCYINDNSKKHLKIFVDTKFGAGLGL